MAGSAKTANELGSEAASDSQEVSESTDDEQSRIAPMREAVVSLNWTDIAALGFGDLVSHCREMGIRDIEMLEDDGHRCIPQVEVESPLDEDLLDTFECVEQWELVTEKDDTYLYILELTATELPETITEYYDKLLGTSDISFTDHGARVSFLGPQKALRDVLRTFETVGATPDLRKLGQYTGEESLLDALTNRQIEAIETAYEMGFYDVPRQATTEDVAAKLGVDAATLSEHLQRAERNLLRREFLR